MWHGRPWGERYGLQGQERVRRQQRPGRPLQGQGRPNRPNRQPRPQPQEKYYQASQNRPLKPLRKQTAPVEKASKPEPAVERVLQVYEPEREEQRVNQEPSVEQMYNEVERSYNTRPEPSTVYERSAQVQDNIESESIAAPAEQRDLEAAVAAGAAAYAGVKNTMLNTL